MFGQEAPQIPMTNQADCPECDASVPFSSSPQKGQRVLCPSCHSVLIVNNLKPIRLDWAFVEPFNSLTGPADLTPLKSESDNPSNHLALPEASSGEKLPGEGQS